MITTHINNEWTPTTKSQVLTNRKPPKSKSKRDGSVFFFDRGMGGRVCKRKADDRNDDNEETNSYFFRIIVACSMDFLDFQYFLFLYLSYFLVHLLCPFLLFNYFSFEYSLFFLLLFCILIIFYLHTSSRVCSRSNIHTHMHAYCSQFTCAMTSHNAMSR